MPTYHTYQSTNDVYRSTHQMYVCLYVCRYSNVQTVSKGREERERERERERKREREKERERERLELMEGGGRGGPMILSRLTCRYGTYRKVE